MMTAILLLALLVLLLLIDWRQTLVIARPGGWYERNPLLGRDPSRARVHAYFALCIVLVLVGAYMLRDEPVVVAWLAGVAAVLESAPVLHNHFRLGIKT